MLGVPRQVKGPKPWPIHPWMVSFYDGMWRCQAGVIRDSDYVSGSNERTISAYVQNCRQNIIQYGGGGVKNEKGGSNNPKSYALSSPSWTGGNKIYRNSSSLGMGAPSQSQSSEIPDDGCVTWASGAFSSTQPTYVFLRKITFSESNKRWHVLAASGSISWEEDDIVIAKVEPTSGSQTGWLVAQILKSDVFLTGEATAGPSDHPWKVTCNNVANGVDVTIRDGSINNVMLQNPEYEHSITEVGEYSVLLKVTCLGLVYPNEVIWSVVKDWSPYTAQNTLTECWLKVAHVKVEQSGNPPAYTNTITQLISSSLRSERLKHGNGLNAAKYFFNRV